jgi:hypothetical protein
MDPSDALERLLVAASLAVKVASMPVRQDGTTPKEYASSGPTFANRVKADPSSILSVACQASPLPPPSPAPYCWAVRVKAGGVRQTLYRLWLNDSPGQVDEVLAARKAAARLRASLPHAERRKKPWGPL